jgi:hypothetical protein
MNAVTIAPQAINFSQAVESIRSLSSDSTAAAIAQGRLLLHIEAEELYRERYPSMTAFLAGELLGISAHEARRRMQVAQLVDTEPAIPSGLCLSVLKRLVPLAGQNRSAFAQIVAHESLPSLTVIEVDALIASAVDRRHVATTDRLFKRVLDDMKRAQQGLSGFAREQLEAMIDSALQLVDQASAILGDERRHVATTHAHTYTHAPMESMSHESMDSKNHESMDSMVGQEAERQVETSAGSFAVPLTGEAVLQALGDMGYGKAREQAAVLAAHGVTALAAQIGCIRWELLNGGTERNGRRDPIRNPGALLRRRLAAGFAPPEGYWAAIRGERQHEAIKPAAPAPQPVIEAETAAVSLPPVLAKLADQLRQLQQPWAQMVRSVIERGDASLTPDGQLAISRGDDIVRSKIVSRWADKIMALGVVSGVCYA